MRTRFCLLAACCLIPTFTLAQDAAPAPEITVEQWMERLESKKYSIRNEATRQLQMRGMSVIDQVEKIAQDGSTEAADRAFEILKRHHAGEDSVLKTAAAEALQRIADTEGHSKADAAAEILNPAPEPTKRTPMRIPMIAPGNLQIQIQGRAIGGNPINGRTRVRVKIVNGKKDITVDENGKKLRVFENDKGIRVEKTDPAGKTETKQYKDLEELKTKDPEAHKRFQNNGRGLNIQIRANPGVPQGINPDLRKRLEELRKRQQERRDQIRKEQKERLEELRRRNQESSDQPPQVPLPKPDIEEIKEIKTNSVEVIEV